MGLTSTLVYYFWWHYTIALADLARNYAGIFAWLLDFFSIKHLLLNLALPWRRLGEGYPDHFNWEGFFAAVVVNTLMRLVGILFRLLMIVAGLISLVASIIIFVLIFAIWLALPFWLLFLFILSWKLLFA